MMGFIKTIYLEILKTEIHVRYITRSVARQASTHVIIVFHSEASRYQQTDISVPHSKTVSHFLMTILNMKNAYNPFKTGVPKQEVQRRIVSAVNFFEFLQNNFFCFVVAICCGDNAWPMLTAYSI